MAEPTPTTIQEISWPEWLENALKDDKFAFLYEQLQRLQADVTTLKKQRNILLNLLKGHKHDKNGLVMFAQNIVTFED